MDEKWVKDYLNDLFIQQHDHKKRMQKLEAENARLKVRIRKTTTENDNLRRRLDSTKRDLRDLTEKVSEIRHDVNRGYRYHV